MKIAVFSDVQGNLPAMEATVEHIRAWRPDLVILNGDLVNHAFNVSESQGAIALQSEGTPIQFRNIELRPLKD